MGKTKPATNILRSIQNDFAAKIQAQKMLAIFERFGDLLFVRLLTLDAGSLWGIDCDSIENLKYLFGWLHIQKQDAILDSCHYNFHVCVCV